VNERALAHAVILSALTDLRGVNGPGHRESARYFFADTSADSTFSLWCAVGGLDAAAVRAAVRRRFPE
jgi:hypothetical protein